MKQRIYAFLLFISCGLALQGQQIALSPGLVIRKSAKIKPGTYRMAADTAQRFLQPIETGTAQALITIEGDGIEVDFQGALLRSNADSTRPDLFTGLAIRVKGKNVTLRNARAQGFKVALLAEESDGLTLDGCDFSYNYRPRLRSTREREDFSDWLSYHNNEQDEWLRYGAGMYLKNCQSIVVRNCRATGNQNALLLRGCNDGTVFNNTFQFNSGVGVGLYRCSRNKVMHNRLDWNVRGYSNGFYKRGQDSAALLVYEQSSENTIAFNSCTHSGDGLFLWAGQQTMDSGEGGCNDNRIHGNDFSYAPTNGVEATFSRNQITGNLIRECTYGIWGGYAYDSRIMGNMILNCETAIAIEHGQRDTVVQNFLRGDSTGVQLWAREKQPADWGYSQKRDVRSTGTVIDRNVFFQTRTPLNISLSSNVAVNGENLFAECPNLLETPLPNVNLSFLRNDVYAPAADIERFYAHPELKKSRSLNTNHPDQKSGNPFKPLEMPVVELNEPDSLPGGINAQLSPELPQGRRNIAIGEWGPYDFQRPIALEGPPQDLPDYMVFDLQGPAGNWQVKTMRGIRKMNRTQGTLPESFVSVQTEPGAEDVYIQFAYTGPDTITTVFGERITASPEKPYLFELEKFTKKLDWRVAWYNYDENTDPLLQPDAWQSLKNGPAADTLRTRDLYFAWWERPSARVQADRFLTVATTDFEIKPGAYRIELGSDDGVRLYLDGRRLIDRWDVHEPATDEIVVQLGGAHTIRVEHFDAGGFATLDFRIKPIRPN
ncbi:MAG: NosD domain-containing protein [Saprospiraceae bacterium]